MIYQPVFVDKNQTPDEMELKDSLGETYSIWQQIRQLVLEKYPAGVEQWNFAGKKYGWSFRIKDKKRAILYLIPLDHFFKVAFVYGQKATNAIMASDVSPEIKQTLKEARVYAEGRGIRIDIKNESLLEDIERLVEFKLMF